MTPTQAQASLEILRQAAEEYSAQAEAELRRLEAEVERLRPCPECGRRGDHCKEYQEQAQQIEDLKGNYIHDFTQS